MKKVLTCALLPVLLCLAGCDGLKPSPDGKLIKTLRIKDLSDEETITTAFEYDAGGRVVKAVTTEVYGGETEEETLHITYDGSNIRIESPADHRISAVVDAQGRASDVVYEELDEYSEMGKSDLLLDFDGGGRLVKETCMSNGYEDYAVDYVWKDNDLVRTTYGGYSDTDFRYSQYENRGNIDINWIITGGYSESNVPELGMLGLLGRRSAHYALPDYWDEAHTPIPGQDIDGPVAEQLIGTETSFRHTTTESDESGTTAEYAFDADGDLTGISTSTPRYEVTYETVYTYVLHGDYYEERDGVKYYYDVHLEYKESREVSRQPAAPDGLEVTVGY